MSGPSAAYAASLEFAPDSAGSPGTYHNVLNMKAEQVKRSFTMLDVTNFGSGGWKDQIAGLGDIDVGTLSGDANFGDTNGQVLMNTTFMNRAQGWLRLKLDGTNGFSFPIVIESINYGAKVEGLVTVEIAVKSKGAPTAIP